jgi:hypothetical protein
MPSPGHDIKRPCIHPLFHTCPLKGEYMKILGWACTFMAMVSYMININLGLWSIGLPMAIIGCICGIIAFWKHVWSMVAMQVFFLICNGLA